MERLHCHVAGKWLRPRLTYYVHQILLWVQRSKEASLWLSEKDLVGAE